MNFVFFKAISLQTQAELIIFLPCNDYTTFCKNTLHKSYNFTTYSNITAERTLHKIIITHITFIFTKRSFFKQFKHMMHTIGTQLLCRYLGCHKYLKVVPQARLSILILSKSYPSPDIPQSDNQTCKTFWFVGFVLPKTQLRVDPQFQVLTLPYSSWINCSKFASISTQKWQSNQLIIQQYYHHHVPLVTLCDRKH